MSKSLIIACDGEAASGKSTGAKLLSKKYNLLLLNSGLLYRYASKILIKKKPKKIIPYLKKKFRNVSYNSIKKQSLHSQEISNYVSYLAKNKAVREIMGLYQKRIIKKNKRICVEGRDIATKILNKNPSILGCGNCVIELTDTDAFTRNGKPEDYITKCTKIDYISIEDVNKLSGSVKIEYTLAKNGANQLWHLLNT